MTEETGPTGVGGGGRQDASPQASKILYRRGFGVGPVEKLREQSRVLSQANSPKALDLQPCDHPHSGCSRGCPWGPHLALGPGPSLGLGLSKSSPAPRLHLLLGECEDHVGQGLGGDTEHQGDYGIN